MAASPWPQKGAMHSDFYDYVGNPKRPRIGWLFACCAKMVGIEERVIRSPCRTPGVHTHHYVGGFTAAIAFEQRRSEFKDKTINNRTPSVFTHSPSREGSVIATIQRCEQNGEQRMLAGMSETWKCRSGRVINDASRQHKQTRGVSTFYVPADE